MRYGLIGGRLGHSFSPRVHGLLGNDDYHCLELADEAALTDFLQQRDFLGVNVTTPYKEKAAALCDELTTVARRIGAVNAIRRRPDGTLLGGNTDYYGLLAALQRQHIDIRGKAVLICGTGGAARAAQCAVLDRGARSATLLSRRQSPDYRELRRDGSDAELLIQATPAGMFPDNSGSVPLSLTALPRCEFVLDLVYNPLTTHLLYLAGKRGLAGDNGLYMLVEQARHSFALFGLKKPSQSHALAVYDRLRHELTNIVLIGMPGAGKSTLAKIIARQTGRVYLDSDHIVRDLCGRTPAEIILQQGEEAFRAIERRALRMAGCRTGAVIACGGGVVTHRENYEPLKQNGVVYFIDKNSRLLARKNRPLSQDPRVLRDMARRRRPQYESFADEIVNGNRPLQTIAADILQRHGGRA